MNTVYVEIVYDFECMMLLTLYYVNCIDSAEWE